MHKSVRLHDRYEFYADSRFCGLSMVYLVLLLRKGKFAISEKPSGMSDAVWRFEEVTFN